ncbi:MAG: hypothetical protein JST38_15710 [Bacteroidetes bacterium]|nr:hypothetical protein [Bacteroidota bacterium]
MEQRDELMKHLDRFRTGFVLSKAILEDYCEVVARIENKTAAEINDRVTQQAKRIDQELRAKDNAPKNQ